MKIFIIHYVFLEILIKIEFNEDWWLAIIISIFEYSFNLGYLVFDCFC